MRDIMTRWGQVAYTRRPSELGKLELSFGHEFQEDTLVWHIGTTIFLSRAHRKQLIEGKEGTHMKLAIEALSEYLMFLVAVCKHMLPGLALRSLLEVTREALVETWAKHNKSSISSVAREDELAEVLRNSKKRHGNWGLDKAKSSLLADGVELAISLLRGSKSHMPKLLLELIFDVWVDKLLHADTRCTRESHVKQLSRGGELITIVWIMAEHAGPFLIGETYEEGRDKKQKEEEDKKKKEEEEKRKHEILMIRPPDQMEPSAQPPPQTPVLTELEKPKKERRPIKFATLYPAHDV
jgi:hypothetical protein